MNRYRPWWVGVLVPVLLAVGAVCLRPGNAPPQGPDATAAAQGAESAPADAAGLAPAPAPVAPATAGPEEARTAEATEPAPRPGTDAVPDRYATAELMATQVVPASPARHRRTRLVRMAFKYPVIRVEDTLAHDPATGQWVLTAQEAMVGDHIIVRLDPATPPEHLEALAARTGAQVRRRMQFPDTYLVAVAAPGPDTVPDLLAFFGQEHPGVRYAEPDYLVSRASVTPDDPNYGLQWHLPRIGMPQAWTRGTGSHEVVIAVIDTGIDYQHPDIATNIWSNPNETVNGRDSDRNGYRDDIRGWNFYANNNNPMDYQSHGTHVAGIAGAVGNNGLGTAGINWRVSLMPLRIFNDAGELGAVSDVSDAIHYASTMRTAHGVNVRVINASWGGGHVQSVADAITESEAAGILFVAAAGNTSSNNDTSPYYPASYQHANIIAVANTTSSDGLATSSNYGASRVHLGAPGSGIYAPVLNGGQGYKTGTSMAAPMVSGVAALLWSVEPALSVAEVKGAILAGVDPLPALDGKTVTGGRLNAERALQAVTPVVSHTPHANTNLTTGGYVIEATVTPDGMIPFDGVNVHWSTDHGAHFYKSAMALVDAGLYRGVIPAMPLGTRILYRIQTETAGGWTVWHPGPDAVAVHLFDVKQPEPPRVTPVAAPQQATDGSGRIAWVVDVADADRLPAALTLQFSTNATDWVQAPVIAVDAAHGSPLLNPDGTFAAAGIPTDVSGWPVTNRVTLTWASQDAPALAESHSTVLQVRAWDGEFWSDPAFSDAFLVDNVPPGADAAMVTLQTSAFGPYVVTTAVHVAWEGFADTGTGIAHYYLALSDGGGTAAGLPVAGHESTVEGLEEDAENTVYVWAVDGAGNIGPAASATVLVLSPDGDYDGNGMFNLDEETAGTDATDSSSTFQIAHEPGDAHGAIVLRWNTVSNRFYSLTTATNLQQAPADWTIIPAVSNLPGTGAPMSYTGQVGSARSTFYRIMVSE